MKFQSRIMNLEMNWWKCSILEYFKFHYMLSLIWIHKLIVSPELIWSSNSNWFGEKRWFNLSEEGFLVRLELLYMRKCALFFVSQLINSVFNKRGCLITCNWETPRKGTITNYPLTHRLQIYSVLSGKILCCAKLFPF